MVIKRIIKNYFQVILICLIVGCSPQKRLNRLLTKYPQLTQQDTIVVRDTVYMEKLIPIEKAVFRELSWWDKYKEFIYIVLGLLGVLMIMKKISKTIT